ncbi:MAG TPA: amidohydrolase family protein, partial [Acidimicrobiales bacterium]|nr:amidohydrolase family protein [Acidimicrobiales bacterium]
AQLVRLRRDRPEELVLLDFLDEDDPEEQALLRRSLTAEGAIVASDAIAPMPGSGPFDPEEWPLGPGAATHPRTAGCFSRALRLSRQEGATWLQALARCTLLPARVLERSCPSMRNKGRLQVGADADVVVFDPTAISDAATYSQSTSPSRGVRQVLVNGVAVVSDGLLVPGARPGRAVLSAIG